MTSIMIRYGAAFLAGVFAMWLWHNASISRIGKNAAEQDAAQANAVTETVKKDANDAGENSANYLDDIRQKDAQIDDLRQRLVDGSVRLRVCSAEQQTARLQADNSRAAADEASADSARDREAAIRAVADAKKVDAWVDSCHAYVNR